MRAGMVGKLEEEVEEVAEMSEMYSVIYLTPNMHGIAYHAVLGSTG